MRRSFMCATARARPGAEIARALARAAGHDPAFLQARAKGTDSRGRHGPRLGASRSQSNANSRASATDVKHDRKQARQNQSIKPGTDNRGKLKDWQGGAKH